MANIQIFQIYYLEEQLKELDPDFRPYSNVSNPNDGWREYSVFRMATQENLHRTADYTGILSWKFYNKTGLSGRRCLEFIEANPGFDVYLFNPFPELALSFLNPWIQGELYHPGILPFTQMLFDRTGLKVDLKSLKNSVTNTVYCNYWIGSEKFWDRYMDFSHKIHQEIVFGLSPSEQNFINSLASKISDASYTPFIMERMVSTLLALDPEIKVCAFSFDDIDLEGKYHGLKLRLVKTGLKLDHNLVKRRDLKTAVIGEINSKILLLLILRVFHCEHDRGIFKRVRARLENFLQRCQNH